MGVQFLKKGAKAQAALAEANARAAAIDEEKKHRVYRYRLPMDAEGQITFVDGGLDEDGLLEITMYHEHNMQLNGSWNNWFVCVAETEICPICEGGGKPHLVGAFTVIDHPAWKDSDGKTHSNERRMFVAKRETLKQLQKIATKRGGLAGCTFDTARTGDKSASVGNMFDFVEKRSPAILKKLYKEAADVVDYELAIVYRTAKQLRALGFGSAPLGADDYDVPPKTKKKTFGKNSKAPAPKTYHSDDEDDEL